MGREEQGLVSEIHLRDSELTALEHEVRKAAKVIEELKRTNRETEDEATSRATHVHSLQSELGDALHIEGVRDIPMREDLTKRFPFVRYLIKKESNKQNLIKRFPFVRDLIKREINELS